MKKSSFHASLSSLALTLGITTTAAAQSTAAPTAPAAPAKPGAPLNVLLFTADDMGWFSVASMDSPAHTPGVTPNIDRFASQGMSFQRAHVNVAICQPSRGVLGTGRYPHVSGVEGFYHAPRPLATVMSEFKNHGYRTGILGKCEHSTPDATFVWDMRHDAGELGRGRNPQIYASYFRAFLRDRKKDGKPFYFMCNSHDPHRPWVGSPQDLAWQRQPGYVQPSRVFKPGEVKVPGFLPGNLADVREDMARYCSSARRCDDTFGAIMKVLDDEGFAGNTLVVYLSDNGMSAPFSKTNAYYNSTRTPLVIRYPGVTKPGSVNKTDFVPTIDYMPTVLEAAGIAPPAGLNGRSFLPLLRGEKQEGRDYIFTQIYETSGKHRYPMFTVQNDHYILIYNPWSDGKYEFKAESLGGLYFKAMEAAARTDPFLRARVDLVKHRVPLELYDLQKDPDALVNLANNPAYAGTLRQFSDQLKSWMKQYDPTPLAAFNAFPDEAKRSSYMAAQKQIPLARAKAKGGKKGKQGKKGAANNDDEENDE